VLHFATPGLLPQETASVAAGLAEAALLLTPPEVASEEDDGLLTASEVTLLKLNADWVIMSACNTGGGDKSGEALSGLRRCAAPTGWCCPASAPSPTRADHANHLVVLVRPRLPTDPPAWRNWDLVMTVPTRPAWPAGSAHPRMDLDFTTPRATAAGGS
jgi:hypothetical protein